MKVVILNTSERTGGAAIAANRLLKALKKSGIDVSMLVRDKQTEDTDVISIEASWFKRQIDFWRFLWERLIIFVCNRLSRKRLFQVSIANTGNDISQHPLVKEADIIHLHWINQGFLSLNDIRKLIQTGKPIVWTMHDMWPCTAICHYSYGCDNFTKRCGSCKFLNSRHSKDLSSYVFSQKQFLNNSSINLVAVSSWLKTLAEESALTNKLAVTVIPNVLDIKSFSPSEKSVARKILSFPSGKKIILMGAARLNDPIKGFDYLLQSLSILRHKYQTDIMLVLFGGIKGDDSFLQEIPYPYISMGLLRDTAQIAQLYAASDVIVVPSRYETFGQTIIEGMACGCPAVSFDNSGQTDIIDHLQNGYLAKYKDVEDLARGIMWVLDHPEPAELSRVCREKVLSKYQESVVASQ